MHCDRKRLHRPYFNFSEKEDLVHLLMLFANGTDPCSSTVDYSTSAGTQNAAEEPMYVTFYIEACTFTDTNNLKTNFFRTMKIYFNIELYFDDLKTFL